MESAEDEGGASPAPALVRKAELEDIESLVELARSFYDEDGFTTPDAMLRENFSSLIGSETARVVLAVAEGAPVGFALSTTGFTLESGVIAELQDLYVRPDRRRLGVASLLISDSLAWARGQRAAYLEVVVAPNGRDVSHLLSYYRQRGFLDEGRRILAHPL